MRTLVIIFAILGVSTAATLVAMDEKDLEKVMMEQMYARDPSHPFMGLGNIMARQQKEQDAEAQAEEEAGGEREARDAEETYGEPQEDAPVETPRQPFNMFGNGMLAMMFPEMMFATPQNGATPQRQPANGHASVSNGNGHAATPYAASQPAGNGQAFSITNGNGQKRPVNGQSRPTNGHPRPNGNGNGKRGGGSAAAASATSFNRGSGSFSSSQAQAFGGSF